jgi:hypothetical protein
MSLGDYDQKHTHPKRGWRLSKPDSPAGKLGHILGTSENEQLQAADFQGAFNCPFLRGGLRIRCVSF